MNTLLDHQTFKTNKARLNAAFRDFRKQGILAKQNFSCCRTCGVGKLTDEVMALAQQGQKIKGFVFYNMQSTTDLRENGVCYLSFRGFDFSAEASDAALGEAAVIVAQVVVAKLRRHGIKTEWDGTAGRCICIDLTCKDVNQLG